MTEVSTTPVELPEGDVTTPHQAFNLKAVHLVNGDGKSIDIQSITAGFSLYESINSKFVTGDITLIDSVNLIKNYRFTGQEHIRVHISTERDEIDQELEKIFRVYKLNNVQRPRAGTQTYEMKLCDPLMFVANTTRLSKVYRGSYTEMMSAAFWDMGQGNGQAWFNGISPEGKEKFFGHFEHTKSENNQFVIPNWRADTFLDWVTENADNKSGSWRNSMFLYQTFRDNFKWQSLSSMCGTAGVESKEREEAKVVKELGLEVGAGEVDTVGGTKDLQILTIDKPQLFDTLRGTVAGAYASTQKVYDPITKIESVNIYDILETFNRKDGSHVSEDAVPLIRTDESEKSIFLARTTGDIDWQEMASPPVKELNYAGMQYPNKIPDSLVTYDYNTNHDFDNNTFESSEAFKGNKIKDNSKLERIALKEIMKQHRVVVILPIRTDISAGDVIKMNIPEPEVTRGEDNTDPINDNRYLVVDSCLTGNLQVPGFYGSLQLECIKESFAKEITLEEIETLIEKSDGSYEAD